LVIIATEMVNFYVSKHRMTASYSTFVGSFEKLPLNAFSFPPAITRLPSVEFYNSANLLEAVTFEGSESILKQEEHLVKEEILSETEAELPKLLTDLSPDLVPVLRGAMETLKTDNPDRARHFTTSMRELFTRVLHELSPDDEIREWTQSSELFKDNDPKKAPTRKGRLLFICRNINHGPFCDFIDKDIAAFLGIMDLFQRGTHEIPSPYTPNQLQALKVRAESAIRYIIEVSGSGTS